MSDQPLSEAGQLRRQQILLLAQSEARRRRGRRFTTRGGVALTAVLAVAAAVSLHHPHGASTSTPKPIAVIVPTSQPSLIVEYLQTDPTVTDRLTLAPTPARWTTIDNRELLAELAAAGQPAGIVSMNGKTFLMPRSPIAAR